MRIVPVLILCGLSACSSADQRAATVAADSLSVASERTMWPGTITGFGSLRIGMSLSEAQAAVGSNFELPPQLTPDQCDYALWPIKPIGTRIMFEGGRLVRFEVDSAVLATPEGVRVGDAASRVDSLYPTAERRPHKYEEGAYVIVSLDSLHRLVLEIVGGSVKKWRVGQLPQVEYVEGCA